MKSYICGCLKGIKLVNENGKVLELMKLIYGLCQLARHWYMKLWGVLKQRLKMKCCEVDQAIFYMQEGEELIVIIIHVDDLTIVALSTSLVEQVKEELKKDFKYTEMGEIHWILGFEVKWD